MAKPKVKWLHEEVLQRYIKDSVNLDGNPEDWEINGKKVTHVEYNQTFDAYPDLVFSVEGGETYPVEVEWTSKDFNHFDKIDVLTEGNGCVFLLVKNIPNIGVPQYEMKLGGFKTWVKKNSDHLVQDTFDILKKTWQKDIQRLWILYMGGRGGAIEDYHYALPKQIWGVPEKAKNIGKFKQIKKNDLAMFLIKGTGFPGRSPKNLWQTRHFKGKFNQLQVFRITSDYFQIKTLKEIATEKYGEAAADGRAVGFPQHHAPSRARTVHRRRQGGLDHAARQPVHGLPTQLRAAGAGAARPRLWRPRAALRRPPAIGRWRRRRGQPARALAGPWQRRRPWS